MKLNKNVIRIYSVYIKINYTGNRVLLNFEVLHSLLIFYKKKIQHEMRNIEHFVCALVITHFE